MDHTLCPSCEGWQAHPEDRVCGNCGEILLKAAVDIIPAVIYKDTTAPDNIHIIITKKNGNSSGAEFIWRRIRDRKEVPLGDISFPPATQNGSPIDLEFPFDKLSDNSNQEDIWELIHEIIEGHESVLGALSIGQTRPELVLEDTDILLESQKNNITLQLTNKEGGSFNISDLFITLPDRSTTKNLPTIPDNSSQLTLGEGETTNILLNLSQTLVNELHNLPTGKSFLLNIKSKDFPSKERIVEPPPKFRIRILQPARIILKVANNEIKALQYGRIKLPLTIENRGGEVCTIQSIDLQIAYPGKPSIVIPNEISPITLGVGESADKRINISLKDIDLPQGKCFLNIEIVTKDGEQNSEAYRVELDIVEAKPYTGIVVIDFGTTASAAAYYDRIGNPTTIPLSEDGELSYIPTAIAYYLDSKNELKSCIGQEAQDKFHQLPIKKVRFLDNLKWRLNETSSILLPDETEKQWWEVASDYLSIIKQRIEDHPDITGTIEKVCITQPARFDPQLSDLLCRAYSAAGMQRIILHSEGQPVKVISESWPASMLSMQGKEVLDWQQSFLSEKWNPNSEKYLWLNLDMGGGSTDLSLMTIDVDGFDQMKVKEISCDGDNDIAGNLISNLIYKHISFVDTEKTISYSPDEIFKIDMGNYPIILPWDDNAKDLNDNEAAILNGYRVAENIIFPLQRHSNTEPGIIQETYDSLFRQESLDIQNDITKLWLDPVQLNQKSVGKLLHNFTETVKHHVEVNPHHRLSVTLKSIYGAENKFTAGQITFDTKVFLEDFIINVSIPLYKKVQFILSRVPDDDSRERKLLLMVTGRGAMFPIVQSAIESYFDDLKKNNSGYIGYDLQGITGDHAKTIVCEGASHIAHLLSSQALGADGLRFEPLPIPKFGFLGAKDKETGEYHFKVLANSIMSPEDGWFAVQYPVCGDEYDLNIIFCQNLDNKETFIPKDKDRYNIQGRVNFSSDEAKNTHLLVRLLNNGKLEASIGLPPENEKSKKTPNYEQWTKQLLGTYQLLPPPKKSNEIF